MAFSLVMGAGASSAHGWANGADLNGDGIGDDGYGTHDWIVERAIDLAGTSASWVDTETAILASDDPDQEKALTSSYLHVFKPLGRARGAPQAVADEYHLLMKAYRAGDLQEASRHLGRLSHFYADINQPYHTLAVADTNGLHYEYEVAVGAMTRTYKHNPDLLTPRPRRRVDDVRAATISAALFAREKYASLADSYAASWDVTSGEPRAITGELLSRAVNDLADIITAVELGEGLAVEPASIDSEVSKQWPALNQTIRTAARVTDADGRPIEGAPVTLSWQIGSIVETVTVYSHKDGVGYWWKSIGQTPLMRKHYAKAMSWTNDVVREDKAWYVPSPRLGSGTKGVKTTLSTRKPKRNTVVRAKTTFKSASGKPVKGLKVTFTWQFKSVTRKTSTYTNASGNAYSSMNIGKAKKGYAVRVRGQAQSGGQTRSSSITFTPR